MDGGVGITTNLRQLTTHLRAALEIAERLDEITASPLQDNNKRQRNPLWFRESGHLSDLGIAEIYRLFDEGYSDEAAAREMGISGRGASARRIKWRRLRGS